jgi:hypothetical protein
MNIRRSKKLLLLADSRPVQPLNGRKVMESK